MFDEVLGFIGNFAEIFQESAPWLLLGLFLAGAMKWLLPMSLLEKQLGKSDLKSIIKAALIGAPLPLCSCGVIPAAIGLRRSGASKPATTAFLIATPETGVDSISISYALLGPFFAIFRPISAILTAIYSGLLVKLTASENTTAQPQSPAGGCCDKATVPETSSCCQKSSSAEPAELSWRKKWSQALQFSTGKLLNDISKWLLLGLLMAAAVKTWVSEDFLLQWGDGLPAMLVMLVIGIPMYICATASTPVAAGFIALGMSPGAVLVFMLAGPATNLSTMGMIRQEMGTRVLGAYLVSISSASIGLGYLANWLVEQYHLTVYQVANASHHGEQSWLYLIAALILAGLMLRNAISSHKLTSV